MSNIIKLKRGSGSDPSASDLVVGEVALRTDSGTLFTKKDDGNITEIGAAAGVSDGDKGDITVSNSGSTFLIDSGVIDNANIASNAAIAGTKISPNFGSQNIQTSGDLQIIGTYPNIVLMDSDNDSDFRISNANGKLLIYDTTNSATRFTVNSDGHIDVAGNLDVGAGIDVTGHLDCTGTLTCGQLASGTQIVAGNPTLRLRTTNNSLANKGTIEFYYNTSNLAARIRGKSRNGLNGQLYLDVEKAGTMTNIVYVNDSTVDITGNLNVSNGADITGNITVTGTVDGRDVASDGSKLDGIESGATADQTKSDIDALGVNAATFTVADESSDTSCNVLFATGGSGVVAAKSGSNLTFNSANGQLVASAFTGDGSSLTGLNASNINAGTLAAARLDTATTQSAGNSTTKIATTAFVSTAIANLIDSSPSTLNTLNELASALGDDPNFATTVTNSIGTKIGNLVEDTTPQLGGDLDVQNRTILTNTTNSSLNLKANGSGVVVIQAPSSSYDAVLQLNCSQNSHGVKIAAPPHSAAASYTLTLPDDVQNGKYLTTDANGNLSWASPTDQNFTNADHSKLDGIEAGATADQTASEIKTLLQSNKLTASEIANDTITAVQLAAGAADVNVVLDGAIVNSKVNASAAIAGSKISPTFTSSVTIDVNGTDNGATTLLTLDNYIADIGTEYTWIDFTFRDSNANATPQVKIGAQVQDPTGNQTQEGTGDFVVQCGVDNNTTTNTMTEMFRCSHETKITSVHHHPQSDSAFDLGTSSVRWRNIYGDTLYGDGSNITGVNATTLDSIDSGSFLRSDANDTATGDIEFTGHVRIVTGDITNTNTTKGLMFDGNYETGQYRTRLRKDDKGGGIPLYIDSSEGTANSYTAIARFGSYSGNAEKFEVFGTAKATTFSGSGASLTNIPAGQLTGTIPAARLSASDLLTKIKTVDGTGSSLYADFSNELVIKDTRNDGARLPNDYANHRVTSEFTNQVINGWWSAITAKGWTDGYAPWQLWGKSDTGQNINLYARFGHGGNNTWSSLYTIWHSGNDGSGSTLDADTLDGVQGSSFLRSDADDTASNFIVFDNDKGIRLSHTNQTDANDGVISSGRFGTGLNIVGSQTTSGTGRQVRIWGEVITNGGDTFWNSGNDGSGSGLDSDKLDGQHGSHYLDYDNFTNKPTIPTNNNQLTNGAGYITSAALAGAADGGNAALLDGIDSTQFLRADQNDTTTGILTLTTSSQYPLTINGTDNGKIVLQGSSNPYIRWREGTTDKAYIQWHSSGYINIANQETNEILRIQSGSNGLKFGIDGTFYKVWHEANDGSGSGLDSDLLDGLQGSSYLRSDQSDEFNGDLTIGNGTGNTRLLIKKQDNNVADHIIFYNGTTRVGEIGVEDTTWLRINQETAKNIYTPRYIRADGGFFVDGNSKGINGSGNFVNGTIAGASDYGTLLRSDADDNTTGKLLIGGTYSNNSYNSVSSTRLLFGGGNDQDNYHIGTNMENFGGNYSKLDLRWHTGIRMGAQPSYGGVRIYNSEDLGTVLFSVNKGDGNTRIESGELYHNTSGTSDKYWREGNDGSGSGLDSDTVDGIHGASFLRSDAADVIGGVLSYHSNEARLQFRNTSYNTYLYIGGWTSSNDNNISRIRNSNANLHIDSGANGNLYLNHYSTGTVYARGNTVWHAGNDGSGSGLDSDTLDGQHGSYYSNYNNLSNKPTIPTNNNQLTNGAGYISASSTTNFSSKKMGLGTTPGGSFNGRNAALALGDNDTGVAQNGDGQLELWANNQEIMNLDTGEIEVYKKLIPSSTNSIDLGSSSRRWNNLYVNDMHFSNEGSQNSVDGSWGDWTLQEGEEDIFMINNRTGKKFKIAMIPV